MTADTTPMTPASRNWAKNRTGNGQPLATTENESLPLKLESKQSTDPVANFEMALEFIMRHEDPTLSGIVVHEPNGGIARFGINSVANTQALEDGFYGMEREKALEYASIIYRHRYFEPCGGFQITDQGVCNRFFDLVVNQGISEATKITQRALNRINFAGGAHVLTVDGVPGLRTIDAINLSMPSELVGVMKNYAAEFYADLHRAHPEKYTDAIYKVWLHRLSN